MMEKTSGNGENLGRFSAADEGVMPEPETISFRRACREFAPPCCERTGVADSVVPPPMAWAAVVTASASYQGTAKAPSVAWYVAAPIAIWPGRTTFRSRARLVVSVR